MIQSTGLYYPEFGKLCKRIAQATNFTRNMTQRELLATVKVIRDTGTQFHLTLGNPQTLEPKEVIIKYDNPEPLYANLNLFTRLAGLHSKQTGCRLHLERLPDSLQALSIVVPVSLDFLMGLPLLRALAIAHDGDELIGLPKCEMLTRLSLNGILPKVCCNRLPHLSKLRAGGLDVHITNNDLPLLTELSLNQYGFTNADNLLTLTGLRLLEISAAKLRTMSNLSKLSKLEHLSICKDGYNGIDDLHGIEDLPLIRLCIPHADTTDFTPLRSLAALEHIDLNCTLLDDLSILAGLDHLAHIEVKGVPANNFECLESLPYLNEIVVAPAQLERIPLNLCRKAKANGVNNDIENILVELQKSSQPLV